MPCLNARHTFVGHFIGSPGMNFCQPGAGVLQVAGSGAAPAGRQPALVQIRSGCARIPGAGRRAPAGRGQVPP